MTREKLAERLLLCFETNEDKNKAWLKVKIPTAYKNLFNRAEDILGYQEDQNLWMDCVMSMYDGYEDFCIDPPADWHGLFQWLQGDIRNSEFVDTAIELGVKTLWGALNFGWTTDCQNHWEALDRAIDESGLITD